MAFKPGKKALYIVLIVLIAAFVGLGLFNVPSDSFSIKSEGVTFIAQKISPLDAIPLLAEEEDFIVSPTIYASGNNANPFMLNGSNLFVVVLVGNQKNVTQVFRVVDSYQNLQYCLTNLGDVKTEVQLTVEECNKMLQKGEKVVFLLELPNSALQNPIVRISEKTVAIESNSIDAINNTSFTTLKAMFANAQEVLDKSNEIAGVLS